MFSVIRFKNFQNFSSILIGTTRINSTAVKVNPIPRTSILKGSLISFFIVQIFRFYQMEIQDVLEFLLHQAKNVFFLYEVLQILPDA